MTTETDGKPDFSVDGEAEHLAGESGDAAKTETATTDAKPVADDPEALAAIAGEEEPAKAVPHARFERVNNKLAEALQEIERLKVAPAQAAKPVAVDIDALEEKIYDATQVGDKDTAIKLRREVNAALRQQAEEAADVRAEAKVQASEARRITTELSEVATKMVAEHAFLDPDSDTFDEDAQAQVIVLRDRNIGRGMRPGAALEAAVKKVAPLYQDAIPSGEPANDDLAKQRQKLALQKAAKASQAQPAPLAGGVGARSGQANGKTMTDAEVAALGNDKEGKKKLFAGDF